MKRLYQSVVEALRKDIASGKYDIGARLPAERILAESFNVSRPTIREAVIALEIVGLVEVRGGSGVYVIAQTPSSPVAPADLDVGPFELMEARRDFEASIAALAAERIDDVSIARLEKLLQQMAQTDETGETVEQADREFHQTIAEATQNSAMVAVEAMLWSKRQTPLTLELLNRSLAYGVRPMIAEHRQILDALKARDPEAAAAAMKYHLNNVIDALLEVTEAQDLDRARNEARARRTKYRGAPE